MKTCNDRKVVLKPMNHITEGFLKSLLKQYNFELSADTWCIDDLYAIYDTYGKFLGLISYYVAKARNNTLYIDLSALEVCRDFRGKGVGTATLNYLFNTPINGKHKIVKIYGEARNEAIEFWEKVGANFYVSKTELERTKEEGYSSVFILSAIRFNKYTKGESAWK